MWTYWSFLKVKIKFLIICLCFLGTCVHTYSQNKITPSFRSAYVDEVLFSTTQKNLNIKTLLEQGYTAFIIDNKSSFTSVELEYLRNFIDTNPSSILAFIEEENTNSSKELKSYFSNNLIDLNREKIQEIDSLLANKKQILLFEAKETSLNTASEWVTYVKLGQRFPKDYNTLFVKNKATNAFTLFEYNNTPIETETDTVNTSASLKDAVFNYLYRTGKFSNFILTKNPKEVSQIKKKVPLTVKVNVRDSIGQQVEGVRWVGKPLLKSYGTAHITSEFIFNENVNGYRGLLNAQPYKEGCKIIPKLFTFNVNTYNHFVAFKSQKTALLQDLVFHLKLASNDFGENIEVLDTNLQYKKDADGSMFSFFNGLDNAMYFQTNNNSSNTEEVSISFWVKPQKTDGNHSILSIDNCFAFKIRNNQLCMTFPSVKDVVSHNYVLDIDQWQHIAITYRKGGFIKFYKNGLLKETNSVDVYDKLMDYKFILGSNQWGEFFSGGLKDVVFWDRALSEAELKEVFKNGLPLGLNHDESKTVLTDKVFIGLIVFGVLLLAGILYYFLFFIKNRTKQQHKITSEITKDQYKTGSLIKKEPLKNTITCFGAFKILNDKGEDVLNQLPLKQKIFVFVILFYSIKEEGISPSKLSDILWPGYSPSRSKNIRSTYLQGVRSVVTEDIMKIVYKNKKWFIDTDEKITIDFQSYIALKPVLNSFVASGEVVLGENLDQYLAIVGNGELLSNINSEIIDDYKGVTHSEVLDTLEFLLKNETVHLEEYILKIADIIFLFDPINELALKNKLTILSKKNKRKALKCFNTFSSKRKDYFDEPYNAPTEIKDLLG